MYIAHVRCTVYVCISISWCLASSLRSTTQCRDSWVKQSPTGCTEDLNSSIITESQASAMSPDCRAPMEFSPSFHPPLTCYLTHFGTGHRSRLWCCSRLLASVLRKDTNSCKPYTCSATNTQPHKPKLTGVGTRSTRSYLPAAHVPHMCKAFTWAPHYSWGFYLWRAKLPFRSNLPFFNLPLIFCLLAFPLYLDIHSL